MGTLVEGAGRPVRHRARGSIGFLKDRKKASEAEKKLKMKLWLSFALFLLLADQLEAGRFGRSSSSFNGQRMTIRAEGYDRWEVLGDSAEFMHMDEDIESLQCVCRM